MRVFLYLQFCYRSLSELLLMILFNCIDNWNTNRKACVFIFLVTVLTNLPCD